MDDKCHENIDRAPFGCPHVTEADVERIAERAATRAVEKITDYVYIEVGKSLVRKVLWLIGATIVGFAAWLHSKSFI